jgi:hypothetical protein
MVCQSLRTECAAVADLEKGGGCWWMDWREWGFRVETGGAMTSLETGRDFKIGHSNNRSWVTLSLVMWCAWIVSQITAVVSLPPEHTVTAAKFRDTAKCGFDTRQGPDQCCDQSICLFIGYISKKAGTWSWPLTTIYHWCSEWVKLHVYMYTSPSAKTDTTVLFRATCVSWLG